MDPMGVYYRYENKHKPPGSTGAQMNADRRKRLDGVLVVLTAALEQGRADLEMIRDEEQEYMDNMPEALQEGEKYTNASHVVDALAQALGELEPDLDSVREAAEI